MIVTCPCTYLPTVMAKVTFTSPESFNELVFIAFTYQTDLSQVIESSIITKQSSRVVFVLIRGVIFKRWFRVQVVLPLGMLISKITKHVCPLVHYRYVCSPVWPVKTPSILPVVVFALGSV